MALFKESFWFPPETEYTIRVVGAVCCQNIEMGTSQYNLDRQMFPTLHFASF